MVPGYQPVGVQFRNDSSDEVNFSMSSSVQPEYGCFVNQELKGGRPVPTSPTRLAAGSSSAGFVAAAVTDGDCALDQNHFYVTVTHPSGLGEQTVKVKREAGTLRITEQTGDGRYNLAIEAATESATPALGNWTVVVTEKQPDATLSTAPTLSAERLTSAPKDGWVPANPPSVDDPTLPVFRFTVSGATWNVPGASGDRSHGELPPLIAEASQDGTTWTRIGHVVSATPAERDGDSVTIGEATFDWQRHPGTADYQHVRITNGTGTSNTVQLGTVPIPAPLPEGSLAGLKALWYNPVSQVGAQPRANMLDQAPIRFNVLNKNSTAISPDDPVLGTAYDRVYYRDIDSQRLITGLLDPEHPEEYVAVSPVKGA